MLALYLAMLERPEDEAAFTEMYYKYLPMLTHEGKRFFSDFGFVEDALQMTWIAVARTFTKISQLPRHETAPYLVTIMKNNCRDILRKEKKYTELFPDEDAAMGDMTAAAVLEDEEYRRLVELIQSMPDIYREILERRLILEEENAEAARKIGISNNLAAQRFSRGRALLAETLQKEANKT